MPLIMMECVTLDGRWHGSEEAAKHYARSYAEHYYAASMAAYCKCRCCHASLKRRELTQGRGRTAHRQRRQLLAQRRNLMLV